MVDVMGKLVVLNEENYSGLKLLLGDGCFKWFDAKPSLIMAACVGEGAPVKVGDTVKLKLVGNTKEFVNIMKIDPDAQEVLKEGFDVKSAVDRVMGREKTFETETLRLLERIAVALEYNNKLYKGE